MSLSRIPLQQVFRSGTKPASPPPSETSESGVGRKLSVSSAGSASSDREQRERSTTTSRPPQRNINRLATLAKMAQNVGRGTRTPQMLEYERQADERAKEQEAMQEERDRMAEMEAKIAREQDRIAEEEYEMKQYYEAEALRHAEEMRLHQEEVRRYQQRLAEHERRIRDHEASSEAFAKVIAMPAKPGTQRQVSFLAPAIRNNGTNGGPNVANGA